jgi:tetratricopeptide (TPR) repeat protein
VTAPDALAVLLEAGLIASAEDSDSQAFVFRHALLHEAAYASLLRAERRSLHRAVGETLEAHYSTPADALELAPRLADHFQEAGDLPRAQSYLTQAGDAAARRYANAEAIAHYRRALATIDLRRDEPATVQHLVLALGQALELSGRHAEALAAYEQLEQAARERGAGDVEHAAVMARAKIYATLTPEQDPARARSVLERALTEVQARHDAAAESQVLWNLMVLQTWGGEDYASAVDFGRRAVELARRAGDKERLAFALNDLAYPFVATDQLASALEVIGESQPLWRGLGNTPMLVDNLSQAVLLHYHFGNFQTGTECATEAIRRSDEIGNVWGQTNSRLYYGHILLERGEVAAAIDTMRAAIRWGDQSRHPGALVGARVDLGLLLAELGAMDEAATLVEAAGTIAAEIGPSLRAYPLAARARLALWKHETEEARAALSGAREALRPSGLQWFAPIHIPMIEAELALADGDAESAHRGLTALTQKLVAMPARPFLPEVRRISARALVRLGRKEEAVEHLRLARREAETMGARWRLIPILVDLAQVLSSTGDREASTEALVGAKKAVGPILDSLPEGEDWSGFQSRPDVRAAMQG